MLRLEWTPDCSGKWDYDGWLIRVSSRYWPRGGSYTIFQGGRLVSMGDDPTRQLTIPPSATSSIYLHDGQRIAHADFQGETEAEVKMQVEMWVQQQYEALVARISEVL